MRKTVFLRLPEPGKSFSWLEIDENGEVASQSEAAFAGMSEHFPDHDVVVLVPAEDVLLTKVKLPKISKSKMRSAVGYALEEHLSEDVSSLHFSSGQNGVGRELPVAVVNLALMGQWYNLSGGQIRNGTSLHAMIPESLLVPWDENTWTVWVDHDPVIVRIAQQISFAIDRESANNLLSLELAQAEVKPEKLVVYSAKEDDVSDLIKDLPVEVAHKVLEKNKLNLLLDEYKKSNYINMLQGEFKPKKEIFSTERMLTLGTILFAAWLGVLIVANAGKFFFLNYHAKKLEQEITVVYKELFPKATSVISPRKRVERLLGSMRSIQSKGAFLHLVQKAGPVLRKQSGVIIQSLTFSDNKAQIKVDVNDFAILDQFTKQLRSVGLTVEQSSATKAGDTIQAKLELQEG